ncbi:MAG: aminopeptidase [Gaiellaceae bacterium]
MVATAPSETGAVLPPEQLKRYADAVVRACLGIAEGEQLLVRTHPAQREFAIALVEAGYRAGAGLVDVAYEDPQVRAARVRFAAEGRLGHVSEWDLRRFRAMIQPATANVTVLPESEPGVYDDLAPERVAADHTGTARRLSFVQKASARGRRRWTGVAWPTEAWAAQVYPDLDALDAQRRLARDLLRFCRLGPDDPPGFDGWTAHAARLAQRSRALTELRLERIELRDDGTSLDLRLATGARWLGGPRESHGRMTSGNFPTEENFTSPVPGATEGTFRCSRPLSFRGRTIEGIAGEFRGGRLVRLEAGDDGDREFLAAALGADPGARRLGEVALVDRSSRIGETGRIYYNTLIDENASAHVAFGYGFGQTRPPGAKGRVNASSLHLDVMIGTAELQATGLAADGTRVPLIVDGSWQL